MQLVDAETASGQLYAGTAVTPARQRGQQPTSVSARKRLEHTHRCFCWQTPVLPEHHAGLIFPFPFVVQSPVSIVLSFDVGWLNNLAAALF
jgi:hypothetical protein